MGFGIEVVVFCDRAIGEFLCVGEGREDEAVKRFLFMGEGCGIDDVLP